MDTTYLALLRGINVSGQKKMKMAELRACISALGWSDVQTYIQSGNIVFRAGQGGAAELAQQLTAAVEDTFGFEVPAQVKTLKEVERIVAENPFPQVEEEEYNRLLVTFLNNPPSQKRQDLLKEHEDPDGHFEIKRQAVYLYTPQGYGKSKLTNNFFEAKLKVSATTRNWKTLLKLLDMARK